MVLAEDETVESGVAVAHELLGKLGLTSQQLVAEAYFDLLSSDFYCLDDTTRLVTGSIEKLNY